MRRNLLLSHLSDLSPSLLTKMSLALIAAFSSCVANPAYADDNLTPVNAITDNTTTTAAACTTTTATNTAINTKKNKTSGKAADQNENELPMTIRAQQMTGRPERVLNLDGDVEITRGSTQFNADAAEFHNVEDILVAKTKVTIKRDGDCYSGDSLQFALDTNAGFLTNPVYKLERNNAQGHGSRMDFENQERSTILNGTYTTCEGLNPDWYMKSSEMNLDSGRDIGTASDAVVYFKNVPILGAPWITFPLSDARRSGVLPPVFATTTSGGPELSLPYYFDIAPNRDVTLYPKYITKRGWQMGVEARYMDTDYNGMTHFEINPDDTQTNTSRYSLSSIQTAKLAPDLTMNWNLNRASDDQYAIDYSRSITNSSQHLLPQELSFNYTQPLWNVGTTLSSYQVLQDPNNIIVPPYHRLPQSFIQTGGFDVGGFDWSMNAQYTNFSHPTLVNGERLVFQPEISYPIVGNYYSLTPKISYTLSEYRLGKNLTPGAPPDVSLSVPTFSLDGNLQFERETTIFDQNVTQTLEPRLFYLRTPYRDQSAIPLFDTSLADLNFAQLFAQNRYAGLDRVGDANQLTSALISRVIDDSGQERMRFAIGQRINFTPTLVTATETLPQSRSDFLMTSSAKMTSTLSLDAAWQYSQSNHSTDSFSYGARWQPGPMKVINAEYRLQRADTTYPDGLQQIDFSAQWPLSQRWYGVGRANYSLIDRSLLDGLAGVEYKQDCWVFRFVVQRYAIPSAIVTTATNSTTSWFFQLELNGLSKIGSNPVDVLKRSISGYQPVSAGY